MLLRSLRTATVAAIILCPVLRADNLYTNDGSKVYGYALPLSGNGGGSSVFTFSNNPESGIIGMAYEPGTGALLAAPSNGSVIYAYSANGTPSIFASSSGANLSNLTDPMGLAIDASGDVYVGAAGGTVIDELSSGGAFIRSFGAGLGLNINSLAISSAGVLVEADNGGTVNQFTLGSTPVESTYANLALGDQYYGLAFDGAGDLYVSYWNGDGGGIYEVAAGTAGPSANATNVYSEPGFLPVGLAYSPDNGNLYMSYIDNGGPSNGGIDVFYSAGGGTVSVTNSGAHTFVNNLNMPYGLLVVTPEPGTWLMLATGLLAITLFRLRPVRQ